jgi:NAD(P)H-flavin reductase/hemoglobin-like flavoprotein
MTAEQLLASGPTRIAETRPDGPVALIRSSFAVVAPRAEEVARHFYATLFSQAPATRDLFPVNMEVQRSRLLRALVHVVQMVDRPDELVPFLEQLGRDHRKFGVLTEHYDAVGAALLSAVAEFAGPAFTPEVEQAWTGAYGTVAKAMRTAARAERGPATWLGRVVGHRRVGWDLAVIEVAASEPVPYRAGQYVSVETPQRPRLWRYLSPANAPSEDGRLEFHVRAVPGGWVSRSIVAHSRVGDTWRIGPPMGRMQVARNSRRNVLMVAGGTGSAPIRALLEDLARGDGRPRTQVFIGGRTWDDLYDFAPLRRLSYDNPWLDVVPVVERDDPGNGGAEIGTLSDVVTRYGSWADHDVTVCGSPAMIRSTVSQMLVAGTPLDRITYDPFTLD